MTTATSEKIIKDLIKQGVKLTDKDKTLIRKHIYQALSDSYKEGQNYNGCGCGQPSCSICN